MPTLLGGAVRAVEMVHGDGELPTIPLRLNPALGSVRGRFRFDEAGPISISVNPDLRHAALAVVHEIGHFLDFSGIGEPGTFASVSGAAMQLWRDAVRATMRFGELSEAVDDAVRRMPEGTDAYREPLLPEELWARSYAQYIALRSRDGALLNGVSAFRDARGSAEGRIGRLLHWNDEEFEPVAEAIEALFRGLGWRSAR